MGEDFGPKDLAALSSGDFLKEEEDRLAAFFRDGERLIEIAGPLDGANFHRAGFGMATDEEKESEEKVFHRGIRESGRGGIPGKVIFAGRLKISR